MSQLAYGMTKKQNVKPTYYQDFKKVHKEQPQGTTLKELFWGACLVFLMVLPYLHLI